MHELIEVLQVLRKRLDIRVLFCGVELIGFVLRFDVAFETWVKYFTPFAAGTTEDVDFHEREVLAILDDSHLHSDVSSGAIVPHLKGEQFGGGRLGFDGAFRRVSLGLFLVLFLAHARHQSGLRLFGNLLRFLSLLFLLLDSLQIFLLSALLGNQLQNLVRIEVVLRGLAVTLGVRLVIIVVFVLDVVVNLFLLLFSILSGLWSVYIIGKSLSFGLPNHLFGRCLKLLRLVY